MSKSVFLSYFVAYLFVINLVFTMIGLLFNHIEIIVGLLMLNSAMLSVLLADLEEDKF